MTRARRVSIAVMLATAALAVNVAPGDAHKPITSPFTYNDDVFPILRDRCGRCHVKGGVAPMSLMTHEEAVPWGESIRTELLAGHMPPGGVDSGTARFRNASALSPREMNLLLTWVTGGTPFGTPEKTPPPMAYEHGWRLGPPDLELPFPAEFTIGADKREQTDEFVLPIKTVQGRGVRAVDLKPGNPAIVRAASISLRPSESVTPDMARTETLLGLWLPGDDPIPLDDGLMFELPPSSVLVVRVLYRKTWEYERQELKDRSTVGFYFARTTGARMRALTLTLGPQPPFDLKRQSYRRTLTEDVRAIAVYSDRGQASTSVRATATRPDGSRVELISFHPLPDWSRRYWFKEPIALPRGTVIEVSTSVDDETALLPLSVAPPPTRDADLPISLTLNVVAPS